MIVSSVLVALSFFHLVGNVLALQTRNWTLHGREGYYHVHGRTDVDDADTEPAGQKTSSDGYKQVFTSLRENSGAGRYEKIQLVDGGRVVKSTFVPISSKRLVVRLVSDGKGNETSTETGQDPVDSKLSRFDSQSLWDSSNTSSHESVTNVSDRVRKDVLPLTPKDVAQRKTFKIVPTWLSLYPVSWMTKGPDEPEQTASNSWSKLNAIPVPSSTSSKIGGQSGDKIKKLLNLFTIVKFDNGECYAGDVTGVCLHSSECERKGGVSGGTCAKDQGVCCYDEKTCGDRSNANFTYFVNQGFPEPSTTAPKVCTLTLEKENPEVKQLRLEFLEFQLRDPLNGSCIHDRLVVTGQSSNNVVPEICGINSGQHVYVDVDDSDGPFKLNVVTMGEYYPRKFRIKVIQVRGESELLSPRNCLQYHTGPTGVLESFNYNGRFNGNGLTSGYFNNLNYAICIRKLKNFCSVSYENEGTDGPDPAFQMYNTDEEGERLLPPRQAGAETFDCPDDYIVIGGMRLCGERLNDASRDLDFSRNHPVTDTSNGPFVVSVRTDGRATGRGFLLKYRQNPCAV